MQASLLEEGDLVLRAVRGSINALRENDPDLADEVISFDDDVDARYLALEKSIESLLALQTPVAVDLRFVPPGWRVGCAATLLGALLLLLAFAPGLIPSRWRQRFAALPLMR